MRIATVVLSACALITTASLTEAQRPAANQRTSFTIGVSKGAGALTCTFCSDEGKGGLAGMIGIDTPFRRQIRIGLEADWWMHSGGGSSRSVLAAMPVFQFYVAPSSPLFLKAGLGVGRFTASSDEEELRTTALSGVIGAGYEFRLSSRGALVPYLSWVSGTGGDMRLNGARVTPYGGLSLFQYGLAFSKR
jgi:hypothetical protein